MKVFEIRPKIYFGENSLSSLPKLTHGRVAIFTDSFGECSGLSAKIAEAIGGDHEPVVYSDIKPDPSVEMVARALEFIKSERPDTVIALGGGSVIDATKATLMMYEKSGGARLPLIAVPTTSGTGSEVTKFAVITDTEAGVKYPLVSDRLLPDAAILAKELTLSVPKQITADTGFDVITHALEAYISTEANDFSDAFCEKALILAFRYLPDACKNGKDEVAREKMHTASCLAGMAFNDVSLGVNHGIAHGLGACFHIPHGRANAMLLPHVMKYNAELDHPYKKETPTVQEKLAHVARIIGLPCYSPRVGTESLIRHLEKLQKDLGIPRTLGDAGVTRSDYSKQKAHIIDSALKDACTATNPRAVNARGVEAILSGIERFIK